MTKPKALIIHAPGTNRDYDAKTALELAGAEVTIIHIQELREEKKLFAESHLLVIPGGFSYADALSSGKFFAYNILNYFYDELRTFVLKDKPVIGICNGFQVLVKAGILPGLNENGDFSKDGYQNLEATLDLNANAHFECRNVNLIPKSKVCIWTKPLTENIVCPVAHGEGRFFCNEHTLNAIKANDQIALVYGNNQGKVANGSYPENPNGSLLDIAGICNKKGTVLGLMPHPENNVVYRPHRGESSEKETKAALALWQAGVNYAKNF